MIIQPNYEINISKHGTHHSRVELGNMLLRNAKVKAKIFKKKFTEEEGYEITLSSIECYSTEVEV